MIKLLVISSLFAFLVSACYKLPDIGSGYKLDYDSWSYLIITDSLSTILIKAEIESYKFDESFITVNQKPFDSICECNPDCYHKIENYDKRTLARCREAFKKSKLNYYWIIDKTQPCIRDVENQKYLNIYGPYKYQEFIKEAIILKVPSSLTSGF